MSKVHELKTHPATFDAIVEGRKFHEVRRDDRGFEVGDVLPLRRWDPETRLYTGERLETVITYITRGGTFGLPDMICVMSFHCYGGCFTHRVGREACDVRR